MHVKYSTFHRQCFCWDLINKGQPWLCASASQLACTDMWIATWLSVYEITNCVCQPVNRIPLFYSVWCHTVVIGCHKNTRNCSVNMSTFSSPPSLPFLSPLPLSPPSLPCVDRENSPFRTMEVGKVGRLLPASTHPPSSVLTEHSARPCKHTPTQ